MKFDLLLRHCADLGIEVEWRNIGELHGLYRHDDSLILLNPALTNAQATGALAHEVGHAIYCEYGQSANHSRADEVGASLIISPAEYEAAEKLVGHHAGALAKELDVTRRLVLAWRRWYQRTQSDLIETGRPR